MSASDAVDGSSARHVSAKDVGALLRLPRFGGASQASDRDHRLGIAKSVFQAHGIVPTGDRSWFGAHCSTSPTSMCLGPGLSAYRAVGRVVGVWRPQ
jgi:hypothetical protein